MRGGRPRGVALPLGRGARRLLGVAAADACCSLDTAVVSVRSGVVVAAVVGLRTVLALAAVVALSGVGAAAALLPRGAARFGLGLPVSSACWMFSRSLLTVLLTLRKFLRASRSVVSRSLRTSRVPLVQLLTEVLERFLGGLDGLREPVHRSLPRRLERGRLRRARGGSRSLSQASGITPLSIRRFTFPPKSDPKLGFAQPQTACGRHPAIVEL